MNTSNSLSTALALLRNAVAAIASGRDVAPAMRFRIEGLFEQALRDGDVDAERLQTMVQSELPQAAELYISAEKENPKVELLLWQTRAPVVPSTKD